MRYGDGGQLSGREAPHRNPQLRARARDTRLRGPRVQRGQRPHRRPRQPRLPQHRVDQRQYVVHRNARTRPHTEVRAHRRIR
ncbi:hypothetical protein SNARM312S_05550 [Streptomyces narbonensis]